MMLPVLPSIDQHEAPGVAGDALAHATRLGLSGDEGHGRRSLVPPSKP